MDRDRTDFSHPALVILDKPLSSKRIFLSNRCFLLIQTVLEYEHRP
jgi:hypothetical protein